MTSSTSSRSAAHAVAHGDDGASSVAPPLRHRALPTLQQLAHRSVKHTTEQLDAVESIGRLGL